MTSIEWTDVTWNPVRGCSRVSAGCQACYAEGVARRFAGPGQPYEGLVRIGKDGKPKAQWNGEVRFVAEHLADPLRWKKPRRVFVNSMSDLFHEALPFEQIAAVFGVMSSAPRHTFQVLTKRPERAQSFFDWLRHPGAADPHATCVWHAMAMTQWRPAGAYDHEWPAPLGGGTWPLPNVWLGVSVEDQRTADERIPVLLSLPAAVRWVSYEPALGPVDFSRFMWPVFLDWIVVGGESGPGARVCDLSWVRWTIEQCREAGTPAFVKQLGAVPRGPRVGAWNELLQLRHRKGGDMSEWPEDLRVREWPEVTRG